MSIRSYEINLDSFSSLIPEPIVGRQGDKNGAVTLYVTVTDRGGAVDLTEQTINLMAKTAKGTAIIADNAGVIITDAVNGKFTYEIPNALWSEAGKIKDAYFSLNDKDGQQTTYDLIFIVKEAIDISQDKADDYITIIDGTLRDLQEKIDAIYDAYQTGAFYSRNEIDEFNANFETRISSNETYIEDVKDNSSDAYITSLKIPLRCGWQDLSSGWYPQGFSVNKDKNELYLSTEITGGTETRIEIHVLSTGDLKSMKSFTNEANSFSEGIPYFYNTDGDLCFIVSIVNGNGYAIFNYDAGTIGSNIIINGKFKWGVEGNNFVTTDAFETNITKYSVYDWESIKSGSPTLQQDIYTETTGALFAKSQGMTMANGNAYLTLGAYGTTLGLQSYKPSGKISKQVEFNKQSIAEFIK
ncbi:BppU family phage baseplate upper protein [Lactiplantibacillus plantarum]